MHPGWGLNKSRDFVGSSNNRWCKRRASRDLNLTHSGPGLLPEIPARAPDIIPLKFISERAPFQWEFPLPTEGRGGCYRTPEMAL